MPLGHPTTSLVIIFPPSTTILYPNSLSAVLEVNSTCAIAAILANASPLNPIDFTVSRSFALLILLVACLSNAISISSGKIPFPLSVIRIYVIPPFFISTVTFVAPASIEFSINSLTTDAGLSITSPAAILLIVKSSNSTILPIFTISPFHIQKNLIFIITDYIIIFITLYIGFFILLIFS